MITQNHELTLLQKSNIYTELIEPTFLSSHASQTCPCAIVLGGQPGSGKSSLTNNILETAALKDVVIINLDDLRKFHPLYLELVRKDDKTVDKLLNNDAIYWVSRLMADAIDKRYNILIDQTSAHAGAIENLFSKLREAGYKTEFHLLAVPQAISEFRICKRYNQKNTANDFGRLVEQSYHDSSYDGLSDSLAVIEQKRLADVVCIYNAQQQLIHRNHLENGKWVLRPINLKTFLAERDRSFSLRESFELLEGWSNLKANLAF